MDQTKPSANIKQIKIDNNINNQIKNWRWRKKVVGEINECQPQENLTKTFAFLWYINCCWQYILLALSNISSTSSQPPISKKKKKHQLSSTFSSEIEVVDNKLVLISSGRIHQKIFRKFFSSKILWKNRWNKSPENY